MFKTRFEVVINLSASPDGQVRRTGSRGATHLPVKDGVKFVVLGEIIRSRVRRT